MPLSGRLPQPRSRRSESAAAARSASTRATPSGECTPSGSGVSENQVERPRDVVELERLDEVARVADLPPAAAAHEAPELVLDRAALPLRLLLQRPERAEVAVLLDDALHVVHAERADQLALQVGDAHGEPESFEVGAEAGSLEGSTEVALLARVAETRQPDVESPWPIALDEPADRLSTADRQDGNALGVEVTTAALGERRDRLAVADPFDEHDRTEIAVFDQGYIRSIIARPKPDEETSFASSIRRAKSYVTCRSEIAAPSESMILSAASTHPRCRSIISAERISEPGFTLSWPAYFGAVPWVASNIATVSDRFAPGAIPIPPTWAASASEM